MQSFANFLKHADKDPDAIIDNIQEEFNDAILFVASLYYQDLGYLLTPEMSALSSWFSAIHHDVIRNDAAENLKPQLTDVKGLFIGKSRPEQFANGNKVLKIAKVFLRNK